MLNISEEQVEEMFWIFYSGLFWSNSTFSSLRLNSPEGQPLKKMDYPKSNKIMYKCLAGLFLIT